MRFKKLSKRGFQKLVGGTKKGELRRKRILDTGTGLLVIEVDYLRLLDLYKKQEQRCFYCGTVMSFENGVTQDHFFPKFISWRNRSLIGNCVLSCGTCNNEIKGNSLPSKDEILKFYQLYNAKIWLAQTN